MGGIIPMHAAWNVVYLEVMHAGKIGVVASLESENFGGVGGRDLVRLLICVFDM